MSSYKSYHYDLRQALSFKKGWFEKPHLLCILMILYNVPNHYWQHNFNQYSMKWKEVNLVMFQFVICACNNRLTFWLAIKEAKANNHKMLLFFCLSTKINHSCVLYSQFYFYLTTKFSKKLPICVSWLIFVQQIFHLSVTWFYVKLRKAMIYVESRY